MFSYFKSYEFLIIILMVLLAIIWVWVFGEREFHKGVLAQISKDKATALVVQAKSQAVTTKIETRYLTSTQVIHDAGATIIKKVPIYVTHEDSSRCIVNNGFVQLWNDSNKMHLSSTPSLTYANPSPVVLTDIATQHASESNLYWQQYEQLKALQEWVREEQEAYK